MLTVKIQYLTKTSFFKKMIIGIGCKLQIMPYITKEAKVEVISSLPSTSNINPVEENPTKR